PDKLIMTFGTESRPDGASRSFGNQSPGLPPWAIESSPVGAATKKRNQVHAKGVRFSGKKLCVFLSDGREIVVPTDKIEWLNWLARATPKQRANWSLEPGGFAIYWNDLDDGIEVCHLLGMQPVA